MIRVAFINLICGTTIGALILIQKGLPYFAGIWRWRSAHIEYLLVGWVLQLTMGISFWILPRFRDKARQPSKWQPILAIIVLNIGMWMICLSVPLSFPPNIPFFGRILELLAILLYIFHAWRRVVGRNG